MYESTVMSCKNIDSFKMLFGFTVKNCHNLFIFRQLTTMFCKHEKVLKLTLLPWSDYLTLTIFKNSEGEFNIIFEVCIKRKRPIYYLQWLF